MGNQPSSSSSSPPKRRSSRKSEPQTAADIAAEQAKRVVGDLQEGFKASVKKLDDDHPAAQLIDHVCGAYFDEEKYRDKYRHSRSASYYSEDVSEDGSRTFQSEDDTTYDERRARKSYKSDKSVESASYTTQSDYDSDSRRGRNRNVSFDTEEESKVTQDEPKLISKPLASSFAKRCYFTKAGIGKTTQHYEGLTLTGNVVLMLASAMKLKGCPTICDEDLRRVEQTYPNQFSRLPDELLLSSGWRRISKYCHFSNKPIPDGIPFFHSKQRLHPSGGYYFLLAAAVGMVRPIDVEPLTKDTLVLLETDFPSQCDATPSILIRDPEQWVLVNKFCFFSGGPINTEEDVYYQADFNGNPIYMLAFLSPSLTPEELYKLAELGPDNEPGLRTVAEVQDVESVYDLTGRDFDDLKLYHLGPCRALPQYILQPSAWTKVLPPHFLAARQQAMLTAQDYEGRFDCIDSQTPMLAEESPDMMQSLGENPPMAPQQEAEYHPNQNNGVEVQREFEEEGAFGSMQSNDNSLRLENSQTTNLSRLDPPEDEPPSLKKDSVDDRLPGDSIRATMIQPQIGAHGFYTTQQTLNRMIGPDGFPDQYVSPESASMEHQHYFAEDLSPHRMQYFHEAPGSPEDEEYYQMSARSPESNEFAREGQRPDPQDQFSNLPQSAYRPSQQIDQELYVTEEKKFGVEKEEVDSQLDNSADFVKEDKNGYRFVDTTNSMSNGHQVASAGGPFSPAESSATSGVDSRSHQSPALRGAHEILKRNRRRRLEQHSSNQNPSRIPSDDPNPAGSEASVDTWEESGSDITGSAISGSSVWTDNSGPADRTSRRALILQMARARMKNNKESPARAKVAAAIAEEDGTKTVSTEANPADIDLTSDLD